MNMTGPNRRTIIEDLFVRKIKSSHKQNQHNVLIPNVKGIKINERVNEMKFSKHTMV